MKTLSLASIVALLLTGLISMSPSSGVDSFEVYLNNKLLLKHHMSEPLKLQALKLTEANSKDDLKIKYSQCNAPGKVGKNRKISLRIENGAVVKEWKFPDDTGIESNMMMIPVKELLSAKEHSGGKLILTYSADDFGRDQQLTAI